MIYLLKCLIIYPEIWPVVVGLDMDTDDVDVDLLVLKLLIFGVCTPPPVDVDGCPLSPGLCTPLRFRWYTLGKGILCSDPSEGISGNTPEESPI